MKCEICFKNKIEFTNYFIQNKKEIKFCLKCHHNKFVAIIEKGEKNEI